MKISERLNKKTKGEQLFILMFMFVMVMSIFCITGCGGGSCETPEYGSQDFESGSAVGCSIPGCGGCLTSERGCNLACWPQSIKLVHGSSKKNSETSEKGNFKIIACDTRYYGDGCLGCGQREKSCYAGYMKDEDSTENFNGLFYGSTDSDEKIIGCANGCGGCIGSGGMGAYTISELESLTEID